ncbi:N-(5'-phosphoribosyl)anthranilate isomerase [Candidatus Magnetomoraceae bacterium gMMP-13]
MTRVKICGITSLKDALAAANFGADALGFIFAKSPRQVSPDKAREIIAKLPPFVLRVGVFVNFSIKKIIEIQNFCGLDVIQLHGDEDEETVNKLINMLSESVTGKTEMRSQNSKRIIKALRIGTHPIKNRNIYPDAALLLDTYSPEARGGTGHSFDWNLAVDLAKKRPVILAGGLTPDNVAEAIKIVSPYAVDISSGVEKEPGKKDHQKLLNFIRAAKRDS